MQIVIEEKEKKTIDINEIDRLTAPFLILVGPPQNSYPYIYNKKQQCFINLAHQLQDDAYKSNCFIHKLYEHMSCTLAIENAIKDGYEAHAFTDPRDVYKFIASCEY